MLKRQPMAVSLGRYSCRERIQEKWGPIFRPDARQNKDLEHVRDAIFCQRALKTRMGQAALECFQEKWTRFSVRKHDKTTT